MFSIFSKDSKTKTGFVQVMQNLESCTILEFHFPGLESHGVLVWVMESRGKLCLLKVQNKKGFFMKKMIKIHPK